MQTFVPWGTDFAANAACLDVKRLGKQRVEGYQILRTLLGESAGWARHPATLMWTGYEDILGFYVLTMCKRWTDLGYQDTVADKVKALFLDIPWRHPNYRYNTQAGRIEQFVDLSNDPHWVGHPYPIAGVHTPSWFDNPRIKYSHRSNLVHKFPEHYGILWPEYVDTPKMAYVWPEPDPYSHSLRWGVPYRDQG